MIVVGLDVHKHSLTAVAVDELGRVVAEHTGPVEAQVVVWARSFDSEPLFAVEDCRHVTRGLERTLLGAGERLVRVPPRLTAPQRRRGRVRGKSDPNRRARRGQGRVAGAAACWSACRRGTPARAENCWSTTATTSSRSDVAASSGCAGTYTSSTRSRHSRSAHSTARSGLTGWGVSSQDTSRRRSCGSPATCSAAAER